MEGQITLDQWQQWKDEIRQKLQSTVDNFVFLGYRMKQIRDTEAYKQDGCDSITEWAKQEYGLSKSDVSRFIAINDRFSKDGDSLELREEFRGLGSSKLSEMLSLPESDYTMITEKTSITDIREIKQFNRQAPEERQQSSDPLEKCIEDYFSDSSRHDMLNNVMNLIFDGFNEEQYKAACQEMNPTEHGTHKKGLIMISMQDYPSGIKIKSMMKTEVDTMSWNVFLDMIFSMYTYPSDEPNNTDFWCEYYGPLPVEEKKEIKKVEEPKKEPQKPVQKEVKKEPSKTPANTSKYSSCDVATPPEKTVENEEKNEENVDEFTEFSETIKREEDFEEDPEEDIQEDSEDLQPISEELLEARSLASTIATIVAADQISVGDMWRIKTFCKNLQNVMDNMIEMEDEKCQ